MREAGALDANDVLILCFQSYIVKTPHHTILVDSCIGNDKPRPLRPKWNMKTDDTYMRGLATAGFSVGDIDFVMCTHLHVDHVGWNTRLENGRWVPTFPNARYVFGKTEFDYWTEQNAKAEVPPFGDSVLPIVEANKAEIVRDDYRDRRSRPHPADPGPHAGPCRLHDSAAAGTTSVQRRSDALAAADALSRTVGEIRRRSGAGRRRRGATSWNAIATPIRCAAPRISPRPRRKNPPLGRRIFLRGGSGESEH